MKIYRLGIILFVLGACCAARISAETMDSQQFVGDIDGTLRISVQLRFADDGQSAAGRYFYFTHLRDIRLDAKLDGRHIVMREFDGDGHQTGQFVGELRNTDPRNHYDAVDKSPAQVIVGEWSRPDGSDKKPFYLLGGFRVIPTHSKGAYAVGGFDDDLAVDQFAAKFRAAVLWHDVDAVTEMVKFPVRVNVDGNARRLSRTEFVRDYDKVFFPGFVDLLAISVPSQMFARDQGVMLGNGGEVWIQPVNNSAQTPAVVTINNDHKDEINGSWRITKVLGFAKISAMSAEEAAKWIGSTFSYSNDLANFKAFYGSDRCETPLACAHTVTADEYFKQFDEHLAELGINSTSVTYYEIHDLKDNRWIAPGGIVVVSPNGTLIIGWDGVSFQMSRDDQQALKDQNQ